MVFEAEIVRLQVVRDVLVERLDHLQDVSELVEYEARAFAAGEQVADQEVVVLDGLLVEHIFGGESRKEGSDRGVVFEDQFLE